MVRVPSRGEHGETVDVAMLLGPLSQLSSEATAGPEQDLDAVLALDLQGRTSRLRAVDVPVFPFDSDPFDPDPFDADGALPPR